MSEKKPYQIKIEKQLINVTEEVYLTYYRMNRYERFVEEQDVMHKILYYSGLDTETMNGEDMLYDKDAKSVEEIAVDHYIFRRLTDGIKELNETEQKIVELLFLENMTEREASESCGLSQPAVHKCKNKILNKLRNHLNS